MSKQTQYSRFTPARWAQWLVIISVVLVFLIYFKNFFIPFIVAIIIWYFIRELAHLTERIKIGKRRIPPWVGGTFALIVILGAIFGIWKIVSHNFNQIVAKTPEYKASINSLISEIGELIGIEDVAFRMQQSISAVNLETVISDLFSSFTIFLGSSFLVFIYGIFLSIEERALPLKITAWFQDAERREYVSDLIDRINYSIRQYITVKTVASILTGLLSYVVFLLFGLDFPALWAFIIFLFNYVPYIGSFVATLLPSLLAVFQFGTIWTALWIFACIQGLQTFVGSYLEPRVTGNTLNLSPLVVILALSFWGAVWGVIGMAVSVPITSIMLIIMAQFPNTRGVAIFLSEKGNLSGLIEGEKGRRKATPG